MSIRFTSDEDKTAMFDSVTETAFGPVFDNADKAQEFYDWVTEKTDKDLRDMTPVRLQEYKAEFEAETNPEK